MMRKLIFYCFILVLISLNLIAVRNDDTPRIMGGSLAPDGIAPYMCLIKISNQPLCGCSIISPYYVLTAAHCNVWDPDDLIRVLVGTNDQWSGGKLYNIKEFIGHDKFNVSAPSKGYDVGLIKVEGPIEFNSKVQPIELSKKSVPVGEYALETGWGNVYLWNPNQDFMGFVKNLQMIKLKVANRSECSRYNQAAESIICTYNGPREGLCKGDSGSPLVWNNVQVGIASYITAQCPKDAATAYTDISVFYDWIKSHST